MIPNYSYPLEHFLIIDNHDFHMEKKRSKRIHGNRLYYLKDDWDAARKIAERNSASTKAKREQ